MLESLLSRSTNLLNKVKVPVILAIVAGIFTVPLTLLMPNHYKSEARLLPVDTKGVGSGLSGLASAAASFGVSVPSGDSSDANFVDILNSRWMKEQLLNTEYSYTIADNPLSKSRVEKRTLYAYLAGANIDRAIQGISGIFSASRDPKTKVIYISAETRSPELSQLIVQEAGKRLEYFLREKGRTRGGAKLAFAEARLADARHEADEAEQSMRRFLEGNRNYQFSSDPSVRLLGSRLETELRLRQQLVGSIALNREQALLEEKNDMPILNVLDSANLPIDKSKPKRSSLVILMVILAGGASLIGQYRLWLINKFISSISAERNT